MPRPRSSVRRTRTVRTVRTVLAALATFAGACAGRAVEVQPAPAVAEGAPSADDPGTVTVRATPRDGCGGDQRSREACAVAEAVRSVLFVGVPGSALPLPLVRDERGARATHPQYFDELLQQKGYRRYVLRSTAEAGSGVWVVVLNGDALRRSLEQAGVIRRLGL